MMPENQRYRFVFAMPNSEVSIQRIPKAGHFAGTDQPDRVAEEILNWAFRVFPLRGKKPKMQGIFWGFTGIWKGDEKEASEDLKKLYFTK